MILVDTSVWIDYFRGRTTPQAALLDHLLGRTPIAVGDLIAAELLQGVRDEREFDLLRSSLESFAHIPLVGYDLAVQAASNFRALRTLGVTVRKTIDVLIATRCIEDGLTLLHADHDFYPFETHLGLKVAYSEAQA